MNRQIDKGRKIKVRWGQDGLNTGHCSTFLSCLAYFPSIAPSGWHYIWCVCSKLLLPLFWRRWSWKAVCIPSLMCLTALAQTHTHSPSAITYEATCPEECVCGFVHAIYLCFLLHDFNSMNLITLFYEFVLARRISPYQDVSYQHDRM